METWMWITLAWVACGAIAYVLVKQSAYGTWRKKDRAVLFLLCAIFSPLMFLVALAGTQFLSDEPAKW